MATRIAKQRMKLGNARHKRVERTTRGFGQRFHARPMPAHIHFRAYTPEGEIVGVAQTNDTFMVALLSSSTGHRLAVKRRASLRS